MQKARRKDFFSILLFIAFFIGTIPASLTIRGFDSYRSVSLLPLIFIISAFGIDYVYTHLKKLPTLFYLCVTSTLFLSFISASQEMRNLLNYEKITTVAAYTGWQYGYRQIFNFYSKTFPYKDLTVTNTIAYLPNLYIRFFDPIKKYEMIKIGRIDYYEESKKTLYAFRPNEAEKEKFTIKYTIYYPNKQDIAFFIGELK